MWTVRGILGWCFSAALLFLSSALLFCQALHGILQPDICRLLQSLVARIAELLMAPFGG